MTYFIEDFDPWTTPKKRFLLYSSKGRSRSPNVKQ